MVDAPVGVESVRGLVGQLPQRDMDGPDDVRTLELLLSHDVHQLGALLEEPLDLVAVDFFGHPSSLSAVSVVADAFSATLAPLLRRPRVPLDGRARPTLVARGSSRRCAPTGIGSPTPLPVCPGRASGLLNVVVVRDVRTGEGPGAAPTTTTIPAGSTRRRGEGRGWCGRATKVVLGSRPARRRRSRSRAGSQGEPAAR